MRVRIKRGADKKFLLKLRRPNGDPVDLTNASQITMKFLKKDGSKLQIDLSQIPAQAAFASYKGVLFSAVTPGFAGNSISIVFDGTKTIAQIISDWNTAHPLATIQSDAVNPTQVLAAATVPLASGLDAYYKLQKQTPNVLGFCLVSLPYSDTKNLKVGDQQSVEVLIDDSTTQSPNDGGILIPNALDIFD